MKSKRDSSLPKGRQLKQEALSYVLKTLGNLDVNKVILLGDIFHDKDGIKRISNKLYDYLENLCNKYKVIWIVGNHDGSLKPKNAKI